MKTIHSLERYCFIIFSSLLLVLSSPPLYADDYAGIKKVQAISSQAFIDSLGVNIHLERQNKDNLYSNINEIASEIKYIGFKYARDTFAANFAMRALYDLNQATGIRYNMLFRDTNYEDQITSLRNNTQMVVEVEGPNEVDVWEPHFRGNKGFKAGVAMQKAIYEDVKSDDRLSYLQVNNLTVAHQYNLDELGNMSHYADKASIHIYPQWGGAAGSYVYPVVDWSLKIYGATTPGKQQTITETGWWTTPMRFGVSETVQAKFLFHIVLDAFIQNVARTYIYELNDEVFDNDGNQREYHFGLFHADGTPKMAATAFHNLTSLLGSENASANFTPAALEYATENLPGVNDFQLLLQKPNNTFILVVWKEDKFWDNAAHREVATPENTIKLHLKNKAKSIRVFNPLEDGFPHILVNDTDYAELTISDHPIFIAINF